VQGEHRSARGNTKVDEKNKLLKEEKSGNADLGGEANSGWARSKKRDRSSSSLTEDEFKPLAQAPMPTTSSQKDGQGQGKGGVKGANISTRCLTPTGSSFLEGIMDCSRKNNKIQSMSRNQRKKGRRVGTMNSLRCSPKKEGKVHGFIAALLGIGKRKEHPEASNRACKKFKGL